MRSGAAAAHDDATERMKEANRRSEAADRMSAKLKEQAKKDRKELEVCVCVFFE